MGDLATVRSWSILGGTLHLATSVARTGPTESTGGACDTDPVHAGVRARAEALERLALASRGPRLARTRAELGDMTLLAPRSELYAEERWVSGRSTTDGTPIAIPALTSLLGWTDGRVLPWKQTSTGTAAHPSAPVALHTALLECVERYELRKVWSGTARAVAIDQLLDEAFPRSLSSAMVDANLHARAWQIYSELPAFVVLVAITRTDREQITFGACARPYTERMNAMRHALYEAVSVRAALASRSWTPELDKLRAMSHMQGAFERHLNDLTAMAPREPPGTKIKLASAIEHRFGVPPVGFHLPDVQGYTVARVCVPHEDFLIPRDSADRYVISPGYIE